MSRDRALFKSKQYSHMAHAKNYTTNNWASFYHVILPPCFTRQLDTSAGHVSWTRQPYTLHTNLPRHHFATLVIQSMRTHAPSYHNIRHLLQISCDVSLNPKAETAICPLNAIITDCCLIVIIMIGLCLSHNCRSLIQLSTTPTLIGKYLFCGCLPFILWLIFTYFPADFYLMFTYQRSHDQEIAHLTLQVLLL